MRTTPVSRQYSRAGSRNVIIKSSTILQSKFAILNYVIKIFLEFYKKTLSQVYILLFKI
jgi:hypothetical protein